MRKAKMPKISIIIPMFNAEKHIMECLRSISDQKEVLYECLLIDDGSSDSTVNSVQAFTANNPNFRFLPRPKEIRKGANACRNIGFMESISPYVMFMDADDTLGEDCLKNRLQQLDIYGGHDMCVFSTAKTNTIGSQVGTFYCDNTDWQHLLLRFVQHDIPWHTMSVVWKKEFLEKVGKWDENYGRLQDVELNIRALLQQPSIHFSDYPIDTYYRMSDITQDKALSACYGITQLSRDYFFLIGNHPILQSEYKEYLEAAFCNLLNKVIFKYIFHTNIKDERWCRLYLDTLHWIGVDEEDISQRNDVLIEVNKKR